MAADLSLGRLFPRIEHYREDTGGETEQGDAVVPEVEIQEATDDAQGAGGDEDPASLLVKLSRV